MGALDLVKFNLWTLVSVDDDLTLEMEGQYHPDDGIEINGEPVIEGSVMAGAARPTQQWVAGGAETFRLSSRFASKHSLDDIRPQIALLRQLSARDTTLGRAPRVSFAWGDFEITGYATVSLRIPGHWITGFPRQCLFELEIVGDPPADGESGGTGETQFVRLIGGETFELLGWRYLRSPLRGELIRRLNPAIAGRRERAGDLVRVFEREHVAMRGVVAPTGIPFVDAGWEAVVDALGAERGDASRGLRYDQLPEVVAGLLP